MQFKIFIPSLRLFGRGGKKATKNLEESTHELVKSFGVKKMLQTNSPLAILPLPPGCRAALALFAPCPSALVRSAPARSYALCPALCPAARWREHQLFWARFRATTLLLPQRVTGYRSMLCPRKHSRENSTAIWSSQLCFAQLQLADALRCSFAHRCSTRWEGCLCKSIKDTGASSLSH